MTEEFKDQIDQLYGTYHDATIGFVTLVAKFKNNSSAPDPDKTLHYGTADPNDPNTKTLHSVKFSDLYKRNEPNGLNNWIIGRMLLASIYNLWEDHYRPEFADQLGFKEKKEIKSDLFGEIGIIRNAIVHNQGKKNSKFKRLKKIKFLAKESVQPTREDIEKVITLIYLELNEIEKIAQQ